MVEDFMCNLKVYRVAQGLTQEQLAEKVGVRRETIMRLEKAQYNPSLCDIGNNRILSFTSI